MVRIKQDKHWDGNELVCTRCDECMRKVDRTDGKLEINQRYMNVSALISYRPFPRLVMVCIVFIQVTCYFFQYYRTITINQASLLVETLWWYLSKMYVKLIKKFK